MAYLGIKHDALTTSTKNQHRQLRRKDKLPRARVAKWWFCWRFVLALPLDSTKLYPLKYGRAERICSGYFTHNPYGSNLM